MLKTVFFLSFAALPALAAIQSTAIPQGGASGAGNGGDICEDRFKIIRDDLTSWITAGGPAGLSLPQGISLEQYSEAMLQEIHSAKISCVDDTILIGQAVKTCKNFVDGTGVPQIVCNTTRFLKETSESDQYVLVHHEYAGLAGFEVSAGEDSNYTISNQIAGYLNSEVVQKLAVKNPGPGMTFVKIPHGTFQMGSPTTEQYHGADEVLHTVTLTHDFEMQTTDVTQLQWAVVMGNNPSNNSECGVMVSGVEVCPNRPVETVNWGDIQLFIRKLNARKDGYIYRLPTEAEWEYADRGGTQTAYYFGDGSDPKLFDANTWNSRNANLRTHDVGLKDANPFGLYDMEGNVAQWVQDFYGDYGTTPVTDPQGPSTGHEWVVRGACPDSSEVDLRSASRNRSHGEYGAPWFGFRLVRTKSESAR